MYVREITLILLIYNYICLSYKKPSKMKTKKRFIVLLTMLLCANVTFAQDDLWSKASFIDGTQEISLRSLDPNHYSVFNLNIELIK